MVGSDQWNGSDPHAWCSLGGSNVGALPKLGVVVFDWMISHVLCASLLEQSADQNTCTFCGVTDFHTLESLVPALVRGCSVVQQLCAAA